MSKEKELPGSWCRVTFGQCFEVHVGATPSRKEPAYWGGDVPWVSSGEVQFSRIHGTREHITLAGLTNSSTQINPVGSVLLGMIGEGRTRGQVAILDIEACNNQNCAAIWVSQTPVVPEYVYYWLWSQYEITRQGSSGNNQPALNKSRIEQMIFPLSPVAEQRRIVTAIEQQFTRLDAAVAALKRTQIKLKRYRAAVLKTAVEGKLTEKWRAEHPATESASLLLEHILKERRAKWEADLRAKGRDPAKVKYVEPAQPDMEGLPGLPEGWCWATVEQVGEVGTGATPLRSRKEYYEGGTIPWVTSGALNAEVVTYAEEFITEKALTETNAKIFPSGTLLLAMYGEGKTRGKVSELKIDVATNQACAAIVFRPASEKCRPYVMYFLLSNYYEIRRLASGGVQPNLNLSIVKETSIPLPALSEQEQIVTEVEQRLSVVSQLEATVKANLKRAERLRQSILREAFAGRLVPQDPNDEPASVLLERIRRERNGQKNWVSNKKHTLQAPEPVKLDVTGAEQAELWGSAGN